MPAPSDDITGTHLAALVRGATEARRVGACDLAAELERRAVRAAQRRYEALDVVRSGRRTRRTPPDISTGDPR